MRWRVITCVSLAALAALVIAAPAHAQACGEAWEICVDLGSGAQLVIERRWSFGELFVGLTMLALTLVSVLRWFYDLARENVK